MLKYLILITVIMKYIILFVSDRTGLTAEIMAKSLLAQFPELGYKIQKYSFIDSTEKAQELANNISKLKVEQNYNVVVFSTLFDINSQDIIKSSGACIVDLFSSFIKPLEFAFKKKSVHTLGISQDLLRSSDYQNNLDAIEFNMTHDDGLRPEQYNQADVILIGVSRCGKTPISLYLAMNYSLKACNYPLTDDEIYGETLPKHLLKYKKKLIGLTINPVVLQVIRQKRRPGNDYAKLTVCKKEVKLVEQIFKYAKLPVFNTTNTSIEEVARNIIKTITATGLARGNSW